MAKYDKISIGIDLNNGCNLKCKMCPFHRDGLVNASRQHVMPEKDFIQFVLPIIYQAESLQLGCIHEVTLVPYFDLVIESTAGVRRQSNGADDPYKTTLVTNVMALTDQRIIKILLSRKFNSISMSCDGMDRETYEKIRIGAKFDIFLKRAKLARDIINSEKLSTKISFIFTVQSDNAHQLHDFESWALANGADGVGYQCLNGPLANDYTTKLYQDFASTRPKVAIPPLPVNTLSCTLFHDGTVIRGGTTLQIGNVYYHSLDFMLQSVNDLM